MTHPHLWKFVAVHSVFRPFLLRAFNTALPLGVRILALNPLVLVRALRRERHACNLQTCGAGAHNPIMSSW